LVIDFAGAPRNLTVVWRIRITEQTGLAGEWVVDVALERLAWL
jgi:hypothetical protein